MPRHSRRTPVDPRTPAEWQEAVDLASFLLHLRDARLYGLVTGGPDVNAERCDTILKRGRERGITPGAIGDLCKRYLHAAS